MMKNIFNRCGAEDNFVCKTGRKVILTKKMIMMMIMSMMMMTLMTVNTLMKNVKMKVAIKRWKSWTCREQSTPSSPHSSTRCVGKVIIADVCCLTNIQPKFTNV